MKVNVIKIGDLVYYPHSSKRLGLVISQGSFPKSFIVEFFDNGNKIDIHREGIRRKDES